MTPKLLFPFVLALAGCSSAVAQDAVPDVRLFFEAARPDQAAAESAMLEISQGWRDGYAPLLVDLARLLAPNSAVRQRLIAFLELMTGEEFGQDLVAWEIWMWRLPDDPHPEYGVFKGSLYGQIDPRMRGFFPPGVRSDIRLDEVQWGGVAVNGIPPLDHPAYVQAGDADYLEDNHVVFGISINGDARAYPKRILAWHEMALDEIGGVEMTIIYCTLCGTVLPYESEIGGVSRKFGTSGLLYRSNKLFFDEMTMSLWSTLEGRPVIGRLAGSGLELRLRSSVTTTWGEWRSQHPDSKVLSLETGYTRNYDEGAAYRNYFATDDLMFDVPRLDNRLLNKAEVVVMRVEAATAVGERIPFAIATDFLASNPVYPFEVGGRAFVAITSAGGANRVYESGDRRFLRSESAQQIVDEAGSRWRVEEDALSAEDGSGRRLPRATANRAFWFGWFAQFPDTILIQ